MMEEGDYCALRGLDVSLGSQVAGLEWGRLSFEKLQQVT